METRHFESFDHLTAHIQRAVGVPLEGCTYDPGWTLSLEREVTQGDLELCSVQLEYYPEDSEYLNGLYYYFHSLQHLERDLERDWGVMRQYMTFEDVEVGRGVMQAFRDVEYTLDIPVYRGKPRKGLWRGFDEPRGISEGTRARVQELGVRRFNKRKYWSQGFLLEGGEPFEKHVTFYFHPDVPVRYALASRTIEGVEAGRETLAKMRTFLDRLELIERLLGTEVYK